MRHATYIFAMLMAVFVASCATPYNGDGYLGGYEEKNLQDDIWRVSFGGNGYTNSETVQTYWLYRASALAIEKGFDGFEILSPIQLTSVDGYGGATDARVLPVATVFIPMYTGRSNFPSLTADVRLIKKPFTVIPPTVFDANILHAALEQYVTGDKCELGNVCPHVHSYLYSVKPANSASKIDL